VVLILTIASVKNKAHQFSAFYITVRQICPKLPHITLNRGQGSDGPIKINYINEFRTIVEEISVFKKFYFKQ
jgi:hypothetical protein